MIFKLVFASPNKQIFGGSIVKWYKTEGEGVSYGDKICDLKINKLIRRYDIPLEKVTEIVSKLSSGTSLEQPGVVFNNTDILLQIVSADVGFLRQICAKQSEYRDVGAVLAVFTTEANEPLDLSQEDLTLASSFRIVPNIIVNDAESDIEEIESGVTTPGSWLAEIQTDLERSRHRLAEIQANLNLFKFDAK